MLKKEHIKQAIEAISRRDPDVGYVLDEMMSMGRIAPVSADDYPPGTLSGDDFYFRFDDQPATVKKSLFFTSGSAVIQERLLIKYGEMHKKRQLLQEGHITDFQEAARVIRASGLRFMVCREIDRGLSMLAASPPVAGGVRGSGDAIHDAFCRRQEVTGLLKSLRKDRRTLSDCCSESMPDNSSGTLFRGTVGTGQPALFDRFPFCMSALIQVADVNVDFFHTRFLVSCLIHGRAGNLYACVVGDRIEGLVYLTEKTAPFYRALEIQYIATVRGRPADETGTARRSPKGVGAFLVAGVWMVWKSRRADCKDILLDSEINARGFYAAMGFHARGFSEFVLREPRGRLAVDIIRMAGRCNRVEPRVIRALDRIIEKQFKVLRSRSAKQRADEAQAAETVKACLEAGGLAAISETAVRLLIRYRKKMPASEALIRYGVDHGSEETRAVLQPLYPAGN